MLYYKVMNQNHRREYKKKWRQLNIDRIKLVEKAGYEAKCKIKENTRKKIWQKNNKDKANARTAKYRASKLKATPKWVDARGRKQIEEFYQFAELLSYVTGVRHAVDHIIPLKGREVCGLHIASNLQILTFSENCKKGNRT